MIRPDHSLSSTIMADTDILCISPIDGRELVRRPIMSEAAIDAAIIAAREAQKAWRDEENSRALFERHDQGSEGPHMLNRSFSGTY